jgi:hypothetical protein
VDKEIETEIDDAFDFAKNSPLPAGKEIGNNLFCE